MVGPLFSDPAKAQMRAVLEANMPHTAQVVAVNLGARIGGVASETPANVGAPFNCKVSVAGTASELLTADQLRNATRYEVMVPLSVTTITPRHRLAVSGNLDGVAWNLTLEVVGPIGPKLAQTVRRYLCVPLSGVGA